MSKAQEEIEQVIGMEDYFALGGFIEEYARQAVKKAWLTNLYMVVKQVGPWMAEPPSHDDLSKVISDTIDSYKGSEEEDLYSILMDIVEAFVANSKDDGTPNNSNFSRYN